jgi:alginate O-acetyltransferase complex protein AlgI
VSSVAVLMFLTTLLLGVQAMPVRVKKSAGLMFALNFLFLTIILDKTSLFCLSVFIFLSYFIVLMTWNFKRSPVSISVVLLILIFIFFKKYEFLPFESVWRRFPEIAGLSFIIFRVLTVLFEVRDRDERPAMLMFLNYTLSMFTFLSGPIQRYKGFKEDLAGRSSFVVSDEIMSSSLNRLFNGIIKVVLIAPPLQSLQLFFWESANRQAPFGRLQIMVDRLMSHGHVKIALGYGIACLLYLPFLYFNFSGYTDIVIALGRMAGFSLPENFDHPFSAQSFLDFWSRWHISLSVWFRDYCFTPILKVMIKRGVKNAVLATLPAYFICFGLIGLWHGRTWPFLLCGFMFAVAAVVNHEYRSFLLKSPALSDGYKNLSGARLYGAVSSSLTVFYIALAVVGLWLPGEDMRAAWSLMTAQSAFFGSVLIMGAVACGLFVVRLAYDTPWVARMSGGLAYLLRDHHSHFIVGAKVFVVICWFFVVSSNVPDFVYQGF